MVVNDTRSSLNRQSFTNLEGKLSLRGLPMILTAIGCGLTNQQQIICRLSTRPTEQEENV
jgi:hypothetical protein